MKVAFLPMIGVSIQVDAISRICPKLGLEVGNSRDFRVTLVLSFKLTLGLKLSLGVKGQAWFNVRVMGVARQREDRAGDGAECEPQLVMKVWLPYFNPQPVK